MVVKFCNCAGCGKELLGRRCAGAAGYPQHEAVAERIDEEGDRMAGCYAGRPYCRACADAILLGDLKPVLVGQETWQMLRDRSRPPKAR